jgi:hypothetical protein
MVFRFADGFKDPLGDSLNNVEGRILRKAGRCYVAQVGYMSIRVQRRHIGEILRTSNEAASYE